MGTLHFRPGRHADLPSLQAIERAAGELFAGTGVLPPGPVPVTDAAHVAAAIAAGRVDVALVDEIPAGFLMWATVDGTLHVDELDVAPAFGRRGIGRALMERALARAAADGLAVTLTTFREVPWNEPFYRSLGFDEVEPAAVGPELMAIWEAQGRQLGFERRVAMRWAP